MELLKILIITEQCVDTSPVIKYSATLNKALKMQLAEIHSFPHLLEQSASLQEDLDRGHDVLFTICFFQPRKFNL